MTFLMERKTRFQLQASHSRFRSPVLEEAAGMATREAVTRTEVRRVPRAEDCGTGMGLTYSCWGPRPWVLSVSPASGCSTGFLQKAGSVCA